MNLTIVNPKGKYFDGEVQFVLIDGDNGQIGILDNHSPVVVAVSEGFVKTIKDNQDYFYMLSGGIVEYKDNIMNIITQEIAEGKTLEDAKQNLENKRISENKENRRKLIDFTQLERDLAKNIKTIKASEI